MAVVPFRNQTLLLRTMSLSNLEKVLKTARSDDWQLGRLSWVRYNHLLREIARKHKTSLEIAAGVFSALSPNNDYLGNCRDTGTVLLNAALGRSLEDFTVATYGANKRKAWAIVRDGRPLDHLKFPKTRNFYLNLVNPLDPHPVTIDGHIYNAWMGRRLNLNSAATRFKPSMYEELANDVRALANTYGEMANVIQATIWHSWKRIHKIRFEEQMCLWGPDFLVAGLGFVNELDIHHHALTIAPQRRSHV